MHTCVLADRRSAHLVDLRLLEEEDLSGRRGRDLLVRPVARVRRVSAVTRHHEHDLRVERTRVHRALPTSMPRGGRCKTTLRNRCETAVAVFLTLPFPRKFSA